MTLERDRWQAQVVSLPNGMPLEIDPRDLIGRVILASGQWEPDIVRFLQHWLRAGMTVVDAGAHVGFHTLMAGALVGPHGTVHAFEPNPVVHEVLQRNIARAGLSNVVGLAHALGDRSGTRDLFLHAITNRGATSFQPHDPATERAVRVDVISLDEYLASQRIEHVDVVKIDVEGAEREVLAGAARTLASHRDIVLIVEFLRENTDRFGYTVEALESDLRGHGFQLLMLTAGGLVPYVSAGELAVDVVAVRDVGRLLQGLREPMASQLMWQLYAARSRPRPPSATEHAPSTACSCPVARWRAAR